MGCIPWVVVVAEGDDIGRTTISQPPELTSLTDGRSTSPELDLHERLGETEVGGRRGIPLSPHFLMESRAEGTSVQLDRLLLD